MAGIASVGVYAPRYVLASSGHQAAVSGFDEDAVTMAVEAGRRALGIKPPSVGTLAVATSDPDLPTETVREALGLNGAQVLGSLGTWDAANAVRLAFEQAAKTGSPALIIATDAPRPEIASREERTVGAAAVSLLITSDGPVVRAGKGIARAVPSDLLGDAGVVNPFLSFVDALQTAKKGVRVVLATEPATAFRVKGKPRGLRAVKSVVGNRVPVTLEEARAMRRSHPAPPGTEVSQGAYVSLGAYLGEAKARYRLVGQRCGACGRLQFPPRESCVQCGSVSRTDVLLSGRGTVYSYTIIGKGAAPSEFLAQQSATGAYATGVIELEEGPRVSAMLTEVDPTEVKIGDPVRAVFRRIYEQEGITRYGFKFAPG